MLETASNCSPEYAKASMVLEKVGSSELLAISSISFFDFSINSLKAGR